MSYQKPEIKEQTIQWSSEEEKKTEKKRPLHRKLNIKRIRTPHKKTGSELKTSATVSSSCATCGIRRVHLEDRFVTTTNGTYPWPSVIQIFLTLNQVMIATIKRNY
jgi:hypothetical protein